MSEQILHVTGMTCDHCAASVSCVPPCRFVPKRQRPYRHDHWTRRSFFRRGKRPDAPALARPQVNGSARYVIQVDRTSCEFVIVVADKWSHHGIGHELMGALIDSAKRQGLRKMWGRILASNLDMLAFVRGQGFEISDSPDGAWQKIASITF